MIALTDFINKSWRLFEPNEQDANASINFYFDEIYPQFLIRNPLERKRIQEETTNSFATQIKLSLIQTESLHSKKIELARSMLQKLLGLFLDLT